ncbi:hypothetical protein EHF33_03070 [Deinococcus psychrotolerans]|uniref:Uncharacterized protein n=1 Tax=Deinococcus psychrotolerans TaxID=2489213 RepID=A0A3G8YL92_9DEIO|nr:hypothetical protein [Deinococcus psychrotolerans]AZI41856.1 hypothetical protein EHF33_03070 [Deinococcus psychrotolerans]
MTENEEEVYPDETDPPECSCYHHRMTPPEARSSAVIGVLFRLDGSAVTLADHEALWEVMTTAAAERGLQFSGKVVPVDLDHLTREDFESLLQPLFQEHDPL